MCETASVFVYACMLTLCVVTFKIVIIAHLDLNLSLYWNHSDLFITKVVFFFSVKLPFSLF